MSHDGPQHLHPTSPTSSYHLSPAHPTNADTDSERAASPTPSVEPDSPSASTFLRTAATLDGLARQLGDLNHEREASFDDEAAGKCCCGASAGGRGCKTMIERDRMEERMKLGGEIGQALLARYEVLESKFRKEVERYEYQLSIKRKALEDSVKRVRNLEKANTQHLQQYADMSRKNEALEKRYTQSLHTQTLTQQSLTHVRAELTALRENATRQNVALVSGISLEQQLMDAERRYEDARDAADVEKRNTQDEARKRKRAEARVAELEAKVQEANKEVEDIKEARASDAQDLLNNAKERLAILHSELSETFRGDAPNESPQYQKALEDLVAANALLKHDTSELSAMLAESREETRLLREEVEELHIGQPSRSPVPGGQSRQLALAAELSQSRPSAFHSRTESSPLVGTFAERLGWSRMSTSSSVRSGGWEHGRQNSMVPSIASSAAGDGPPLSPGLGIGQVGEYGGQVSREDGVISPTMPSGRESPRFGFRASPSGALGYVVNGVPKKSQRPGPQRTYSVDRRKSYFGTDTIAEDPTSTEEGVPRPQSPASPGTSYFAATEANRKRRSLMLSRRNTMSPRESTDESQDAASTMVDQPVSFSDFPSPMSESALTSPQKEKRVHRKTLLLLSRSRGVQTEPEELVGQCPRPVGDTVPVPPGYTDRSTDTTPVQPGDTRSETSSLHESNKVPSSATLAVLVEHLAKILAKLRSADIPTLNKRLKKHNLPGDVGHLSRSTMRALEAEVADLRHLFRGMGDNATLSRRDFTLLLKLLKDVFTDLIELQTVVNDVTVDPHLAKKLQRAAYQDEENEANKAKQGSGLGWIAAPITKFFVTPAGEAETTPSQSPARTGRTTERGRLQPATIKASKQQASTSATTTHVSVEFGGTGIVRRAAPAGPTTTTTTAGPSIQDTLPPSPRDAVDHTHVPTAPTAGQLDSSATLRVPKPLHRSKSRANRNELLGIFAGAQKPVSPAGGPWHVVTGPPGSGNNGNPKTVRAVSSTYFGDKTSKPHRSPEGRRRLPTAVDAVIDSSADQLQGADPASIEEPVPAPLLERQLRPRGLSDSSIRSTFHSHGLPGDMPTASSGPASRQAAYNTVHKAKPVAAGGGGILESLSNRFYAFRGTATTDISPVNPPPDAPPSSAGSTPALDAPEVKVLPSTPIPTKAISVSPSSSSKRPVSPTTQASSQNGLFGMLASSLNADSDPEERVGEMAARFRHAAAVPRSLSSSRAGKGWE